MRSVVALLTFLTLTLSLQSQEQAVKRPRILGIDHVAFYTTQSDGVKALYGGALGLVSAAPIESGELTRYFVGKQWVGFSADPDPKSPNRLDHLAFATDDAAGLRQYLISKNIKVEEIKNLGDGSPSFFVMDPDGHQIQFVQPNKSDSPAVPSESAVSRHMIHAGFLVHDRDAEDRFYRDLLGFHIYWHGGMQPGRTDWVAMQVPDGTDWLEYMLNHPEHPDLQTLGVLDHISLGVADMKTAQALLETHGWKPNAREKAQMGKDGKWQLNLFDPDLSRIELMDFKPSEKPCCSDFTGPHPSE
jgi:catechol 2,3-dioxygenase-like lactoylglutathione lyase family enzyme